MVNELIINISGLLKIPIHWLLNKKFEFDKFLVYTFTVEPKSGIILVNNRLLRYLPVF